MWSDVRGLRRYTGQRAVVQVGDQSIDGTLDTAERDVLTMSQARLLTMQDAIPLDGTVVVPAPAVRWVQVV